MNREIEGNRVPDVTFRTRTPDHEWKDVTTADLFAGKKVVVFSLPGAFTPTCSTAHVPRYNELAPEFRAQGVDSILCISVNDTFVMNAWKDDQKADEIIFVPDGNGEFTEKMGLLVDKSVIGFGKRSWRYAMVVKDGVVEKAFIEPEKPGDPYEVSDADTVLSYLGGGKKKPQDIVLFTKPGCSHCARAKALLTEKGLRYREIDADPGLLRSVSGAMTTPQVFVNGMLIGGADQLESKINEIVAT
ncbi:MAG: glutathione peroxidase [Myxococcota bacterium]